jgi:hypothetical protein
MSDVQPGYPRGVKKTLWLSRYRNSERARWTPEEIATVARGFVDLDLDGEDLYSWCFEHGVDRTPGAIDAKLAEYSFFDSEAAKTKKRNAKRSKALLASKRKDVAAIMHKRQIVMAKLEVDAVSNAKKIKPYRSDPKYMDMCKAELEADTAKRVAMCDQQRRAEIARAKMDYAPPLKSGKLEW